MAGPGGQEPVSSGLKVRLISALVMLPFAVGLVFWGGLAFQMLLAVAFVLMYREWLLLCHCPRTERLVWLLGGSFLVLTGIGQINGSGTGPWLMAILLLSGLSILVGALIGRPSLRWAAFGLVYTALPVLALAWLRAEPDGLALVAWTFLAVWATDVGGYFAGRFIGGPKLLPRVSPKKTWAGLLGGMALAAVAGTLISLVFGYGDWARLAWLSALLAVWAQTGDMLESGVKRHFGAKDSGHLIPGHGGILDRVDGLVFVAPLIAVMMALG